MLLFWAFYSLKNPEKRNVSGFPQKYEAAQLFSTLIHIYLHSICISQSVRSFCKFFAFVQVLHKRRCILQSVCLMYLICFMIRQKSYAREGSEMQNWNNEAGAHLLTLNAPHTLPLHGNPTLTMKDGPSQLEQLTNINAIAKKTHHNARFLTASLSDSQ